MSASETRTKLQDNMRFKKSVKPFKEYVFQIFDDSSYEKLCEMIIHNTYIVVLWMFSSLCIYTHTQYMG